MTAVTDLEALGYRFALTAGGRLTFEIDTPPADPARARELLAAIKANKAKAITELQARNRPAQAASTQPAAGLEVPAIPGRPARPHPAGLPAVPAQAADSMPATQVQPVTLADLLAAADFPTGRPAWPCWACGADAWQSHPAELGGGYFCAVCHPLPALEAVPA